MLKMISRRKLLLGGLVLSGGLLSSNYKKIARAQKTVRNADSFDVAVIGGGVAGLQAALTLGRSCRKVIVFDAGSPRNMSKHPLHNFVGQDGVEQARLLQEATEQLKQYDVTISHSKVTQATKIGEIFSIANSNGLNVSCKKILLATGVKDELPHISGLAGLWGKSVLYCPYCSGWEFRDKPLAVLGQGDAGAYAVMTLSGWSQDLMLLTDGPANISQKRRLDLDKLKVQIIEEKLVALEGVDSLETIVLAGGKRLKRDALFIQPMASQRSDLLISLGAKLQDQRFAGLDPRGQTSVHGLYVAGDASGKIFPAIGAAADGAAVAFAVNRALIFESLQSRGVAID